MSRKNGGIIGPANTPVGGLVVGVAGGVWRMNDLTNFVSNNQWPKTPENIENSLRFDDGSSDNLTKSFDSAGNRSVWTWSAWIKFSTFDSFHPIFTAGNWSSGSTATGLVLYQGSFYTYWNSPSGGTSTTAKFRDTSAWYHVVLQANTSTLKLYVNSVEQTSKSISGSGEINNSSSEHGLGKYSNSTSAYFDGYMAEVCFIDGQALDPTSFGETDTATGIWKPKKIGQIANAGTNSFYLNFKDSSNVGKDESGLSNNFTVNNLTSIDQTTDTCTNNFATMNTLTNNGTLSEGNLKVVTSTSLNDLTTASTIHVSQGKWYAEFKCTASTSGTNFNIGITSDPFENIRASEYIGQSADSYGVLGSNGNFYNSASSVSYMNSFTTGDIIGVALDLDNNYIYYSKNGTWQNSGDPESGSSGTGGKSITAASSQSTGVYAFAVGDASGSSAMTFEINYGNPTFSISSGNSDANGHGNFEYAVPSGYYALNTSNLNTYG